MFFRKKNIFSSPAVVAWFVKASLPHSVDRDLCATGGSNPSRGYNIDYPEQEIACGYSNSRTQGSL